MTKAEALTHLRQMVPPGTTIYTVLRNCSRSGMTRSIDLYLVGSSDGPTWISGYACAAAGFSWDKKRDCIKVGGCGMDMGFALVYDLGHALYPDGFECTGDNECPSNDHSNGDRDYTPHHHRDYSLKHRWM